MQELLSVQRSYFQTGATLPYDARRDALRRLDKAITRFEGDFTAALHNDLGKSTTEAYISEIGLLHGEINYALRHLRRWMRPKRKATPLANLPGRQWVLPSPYGVALILAPWNYPLLLSLAPLVGALAAGNCALLKPSELAPATTEVLSSLIEETFPKELVGVVNGGAEVAQGLLELPFDYIFYTGNGRVGRYVMEKAAAHLTPVTLELGGKSPVIVTRSAAVRQAARRIVFGKFLNCGQTCVAPDYILVEPSVHAELVACLKEEIVAQYGAQPLANPDYGHIINARHFDRLMGLITAENVVWGGAANPAALQIAPTLLDHVTADDAVMQEEIFGPLLPIIEVPDIEAAAQFVSQRPHPLALYLFTRERRVAQRIIEGLSFGGGCVNDVLVHIAATNLPFGGVGASGMGVYHGHDSFATFSHPKAILKRATWWDPRFRYAPYTPFMRRLLRRF